MALVNQVLNRLFSEIYLNGTEFAFNLDNADVRQILGSLIRLSQVFETESYLMTIFKRISAVLFGVFMVTAVSPDARAVPVNVTFSSGISSSSGALSGLTQWTLSFTVDNNGTSLLSQTWTSSDITTVVDGFGVGNGYTATYIGVDNFKLETDATGAFLNSAIFDDTSTGVGGNFDSIPSGAAVMTTAGPTAGGINFALMSISTQTESGWSIELTDQGGGDVPEPGTLALFGVGLLGVGFIARRRRKV